MNTNVTALEIICPKEPDMEGEFNKKDTEEEMREILEREPEENEWIEWVMFHDDVDSYFTDEIVNVVQMPEFRSGTFTINGVDFTIEKT